MAKKKRPSLGAADRQQVQQQAANNRLNQMALANQWQPVQAPPPDPYYDQRLAHNQKAYGDAIADLDYQTAGTEKEYGFKDTSNPYNRAAMLEKSYKEGQSGNLNSMASAGQLYSGALQRQQEAGTFKFNQNTNSLRKAYDDTLHGYATRRTQLWNALQEGNLDQLQARNERAAAYDPQPTQYEPDENLLKAASGQIYSPKKKKRR